MHHSGLADYVILFLPHSGFVQLFIQGERACVRFSTKASGRRVPLTQALAEHSQMTICTHICYSPAHENLQLECGKERTSNT